MNEDTGQLAIKGTVFDQAPHPIPCRICILISDFNVCLVGGDQIYSLLFPSQCATRKSANSKSEYYTYKVKVLFLKFLFFPIEFF